MLIGVDASRTTAARRTGTEAYSLKLLQALLALDTPHSWRLYFNDPPPAGIWPARSGVECLSLPSRRLWTHGRLSLEMLRRPPDVLFVPAHVLPLWRPTHCVATVHDLGYRHFPQAHPKRARAYLEWSTRWNARQSRAVLTDSEATARDLMDAYATPTEKIRVVYPGGPEGLAHVPDGPARQSLLARLGIDAPYSLYVGTLQPRKNLERLIEAYALLRRHWGEAGNPPLLVLAGGRGWLSEGIFQRIAALSLQPWVRMPGYVADADLPALLSGASAFAFPSLYEGFGFPVLEAMACEVPVICAKTSSLPEVAGQAAILVDPLDVPALSEALERVLTDHALRARLIEAGRQQCRRFSWERAARQTLAVLEEVGRCGR